MSHLVVETVISAPPEVCFDLARDIELHCKTAEHTGERAVAGVTSGLIGSGDWVTFEGVHFGIRQRLTARIVEFDAPRRFVDEMTQGAFKSLKHIHEFDVVPGGTLMRDTIQWISPLGPLGRIANVLFLKRHLRSFLVRRNAHLKQIAESRTTN